MTRRVYLDHNATVPIRPEVLDTMSEVLQIGGNASSVHAEGRKARQFLEVARENIASFVDGETGGVIFTGGGTEACNLALQTRKAPKGVIRRILVSSIEHAAVLAPLDDLTENEDISVTHLPVSEQGVVDLKALSTALEDPSPALVVVMAANNETGVIQPIEAVTNLASDFDALVHVDAVQAFGKLPINFLNSGIDMLSISAHKIGGPTGVGALIIRDDLNLKPIIVGGGQERGRRSGTENLAGIAGFGAAAEACSKQEDANKKIVQLRDYFEKTILAKVPSAKIIAHKEKRLGNTSAVFMPGLTAETQVMAFDLAGIAVSAGAACSSGKVRQSHVLKAMNLPDELINNTIRISFGWQNSEEDVNRLIEAWLRIYQDSN